MMDGAAVGFGADLAFACDLRVASSRAYAAGEVREASGSCPTAAERSGCRAWWGRRRAMQMVLLAEKIDGGGAASAGRSGAGRRAGGPARRDAGRRARHRGGPAAGVRRRSSARSTRAGARSRTRCAASARSSSSCCGAPTSWRASWPGCRSGSRCSRGRSSGRSPDEVLARIQVAQLGGLTRGGPGRSSSSRWPPRGSCPLPTSHLPRRRRRLLRSDPCPRSPRGHCDTTRTGTPRSPRLFERRDERPREVRQVARAVGLEDQPLHASAHRAAHERGIEPGEHAHGEHAWLDAFVEGRQIGRGPHVGSDRGRPSPAPRAAAQLGSRERRKRPARRASSHACPAQHARREGDAHLGHRQRRSEDGVHEVLPRVGAHLGRAGAGRR